jgi:uncharacterized protein (TIGR03437 family)
MKPIGRADVYLPRNSAGQFPVLYGTGIGPINPSPALGAAAGYYPNLSVSDSNYAVTVNGANAPVSYLGLTPGLAGGDATQSSDSR